VGSLQHAEKVGVASQWDLKSGQCIHELGNDAYEGITCVAADDNKLAVGDLEGMVRGEYGQRCILMALRACDLPTPTSDP
jgi:hypothetical protein